MKVFLPDGNELELDDGATGADAAAAISAGLARVALAVRVNDADEVQDLSAPLSDGDRIRIITPKSEGEDGAAALWLVRHDAAHVLATAALELFPGVKISIGPPIENGFYYDFDFPDGVTVSDADFERIEQKMREHIKADEPFVREDVPVAEALERFRAEDQPYKVELIEDLVRRTSHPSRPSASTPTARSPTCARARTRRRPSASRRSSSSRSPARTGAATRTASSSPASTAPRSSPRRTSTSTSSAWRRPRHATTASSGPSWGSSSSRTSRRARPSGCRPAPRSSTGSSRSRGEMCEAHGYTEVKTPQLYDSELWKTSGHWFKYRDNMFVTSAEDRELALKPMNCPGHCQLFKLQQWSYRDLPVRYAEPGLLHRNELSGTLHGLLRVRHFVQDDAHIFCTPEQTVDEVKGCLDMAFETYDVFGIKPKLELSTRPDERIGTDEAWDEAEGILARALEDEGPRVRRQRG